MIHEESDHGRLAAKRKISRPISAFLIAAFLFDSEPLPLALSRSFCGICRRTGSQPLDQSLSSISATRIFPKKNGRARIIDHRRKEG